MDKELNIQILQNDVMVPFFLLKVSVEFFPKYYRHVEFQYQVDSIVVTSDCVPVLVFSNN